ncbi:PKD domain-containing protein [Hahella sp. KA22]|uniref:PKD domain-containing protein n=1 Tax=Hahella sp. KA22 TaxID=1628392 RepID=UPI000FDD6647|nr:PKD domain-containing protein [Hahella sp. KA22]AZZ91938.1 PKD domain-containing protein [Hahella sp. KA22]QAY55309.1 PKD domain-containing protein [Hahella sp. KA22]
MKPVVGTLLVGSVSLGMVGCSGGGGSGGSEPVKVDPPANNIAAVYFRDQDGAVGAIGGGVEVQLLKAAAQGERVRLYWMDPAHATRLGGVVAESDSAAPTHVTLPNGSHPPQEDAQLFAYTVTSAGESKDGAAIKFLDYQSNAEVQGPGGSALAGWRYGADRPALKVSKSDDGRCTFDNGLVQVIDMANGVDAGYAGDQSNTIDERNFPPYDFDCSASMENSFRTIWADDAETEVWTYSSLNDALFYGTLTHDMFAKYLGEPPLEGKLRLRVHYGDWWQANAYWDGAYANFSDAVGVAYGLATLDIVAHEIGHGVLSRISRLKVFGAAMSSDARTVHEAFGDISGAMAKYEYTGELDWVHAKESNYGMRQLERIVTETGAIASYFDYDDAGNNVYLRIGMMTYPFYQLANKWSPERAYQLYIKAARDCWDPQMDMRGAAQCLRTAAIAMDESEQDVVTAFRAVKIKLLEQDTLAHFKDESYKLRVEFADDSRSDSTVASWRWEFGDGLVSTEASPQHLYDEKGTYEVSLQVTDVDGRTDRFSKSLSVTDEYCAFYQAEKATRRIDQVTVAGTVIDAPDPLRTDYTENAIAITDASAVTITVKGDKLAASPSNTWKIWLDADNDGRFEESANEMLREVAQSETDAYELTTTIQLPDGLSGGPLYMRIAGDYAINSSCTLKKGSGVDIRIAPYLQVAL